MNFVSDKLIFEISFVNYGN